VTVTRENGELLCSMNNMDRFSNRAAVSFSRRALLKTVSQYYYRTR